MDVLNSSCEDIIYCLDFTGVETTQTTVPKYRATLDIEVSQKLDGIEAGSTPSLICKISEHSHIQWRSKGRNLTTFKDSENRGRIDLKNASRSDTGNYTCVANTSGGEYLEKTVFVRVIG